MAAKLAPILLTHLHHPRYSPFGPDPKTVVPPFQVWLPNATHLEMLHHLNYTYTFTKYGPASRHLLLNQLGQACGWLFREAQRPGQLITLVATDVLRDAFTFPAEGARLGHPGFLLAWLQAKGNRDQRMAAAAVAERLSAATSLDPAFERDELEFYVDLHNTGRREEKPTDVVRATKQIHTRLGEELERRFRLVEAAIGVLQKDKRPENRGLPLLVDASMDEHTRQFRRLEQELDDKEDGPAFRPSPETDRYPSAAASRFYVHEASQELRDTLLVHDDAELQADLVAAGEAIAGVITDVRDEGSGRRTVPVWTIDSSGDVPLRVRVGATLCVAGLPSRHIEIRSIERRDGAGYRFEAVVTALITGPRKSDGTVLPATSPKLKKQRVVLVDRSMDQIARKRSFLVWRREVPGAWLTHSVPAVPRAEVPEGVGEDLARLTGES